MEQEHYVETPLPSNSDTNAPRRIDNYELVHRLGGGGMGEVYLARHHKFRDRMYAIKLLKPGLVSDEAMARFEHEIDVTGRLKHPNIVYAFDAGRSGNEPYLVMEYVRGCDLQQLVKKQGPLAVADACELIRQAAEGLQHAFQSGLTHRDIKPSNLMLSADGSVKLLDLGLAKLREQHQSSGLTNEGQYLGTPDYMAPEQWSESSSATTTADIYSLACSLFTLLTGHPPFWADKKSSLVNKMKSHLEKPPPDVRKARAEVPEGLAELILKCLAKEPNQRCQTPKEFSLALKPFAAEAELSKYESVTDNDGTASLIPTKDLVRSDIATGIDHKKSQPEPSSPLGKFVAIALTLMALAVIGWIFRPDLSSSGASAGNPVEVKKFDILANRFGTTFQPVESLNQLQPDEAIRFSIELSEPAYAKLLWVDAFGNSQELYPNDPEQGNLGEGPVTGFESPVEIDRGWPLEPVGRSEMALLLVSRDPIPDQDLPDLELGPSGAEIGNRIVRYQASRFESVRTDYGKVSNADGDEVRGVGTTTVQVDDPVLQFLERLRQQSDAIRAVRIPMTVNN